MTIEDGRITAVDLDDGPVADEARYIAPGFVDVHVHGWGGHDAMGDADALDGMARALLRRGVTSFLPTAVTAPLDDLAAFAERVRAWQPDAPADGAEPLGFNLEGPFLADGPAGRPRRGPPAGPGRRRRRRRSSRCVDGLRLITIAPELPGALDLIGWLRERGVAVSVGHSAATLDEARAGYAAGRVVHDPPVQRDDRRRPPIARGSRSRRSSTTRPTSSSSPTASTSTRRCGR